MNSNAQAKRLEVPDFLAATPKHRNSRAAFVQNINFERGIPVKNEPFLHRDIPAIAQLLLVTCQ